MHLDLGGVTFDLGGVTFDLASLRISGVGPFDVTADSEPCTRDSPALTSGLPTTAPVPAMPTVFPLPREPRLPKAMPDSPKLLLMLVP